MATKYIKWPQNISNGHKIYQMAIKYTKWRYTIPTYSIARLSKTYPNRDFWSRVATLFFVQDTETGKYIPNDHKIYQMVVK
jgi:hypothetical protein